MISRLLVVAGAGDYPRLVVEGAKRAAAVEKAKRLQAKVIREYMH